MGDVTVATSTPYSVSSKKKSGYEKKVLQSNACGFYKLFNIQIRMF